MPIFTPWEEKVVLRLIQLGFSRDAVLGALIAADWDSGVAELQLQSGSCGSGSRAPAPIPRDVEECPVCLEEKPQTQMAEGLCGHRLCEACMTTLAAEGLPCCPLCRNPLKDVTHRGLSRSVAASRSAAERGYVVIRVPPWLDKWAGWHPSTSWKALEDRMGLRGQLAGHLSELGIYLHGASDFAEALRYWEADRQERMPTIRA